MKNKNFKKDLATIALCTYLVGSFLNGKVYNDHQKAIEENNGLIKEYPAINTLSLHLENIKFQKVVDATKKNLLYFPFGLMYDLAYKRPIISKSNTF